MKIVFTNVAKRFALGVMPREGMTDDQIWDAAWKVARSKSIGTVLKDGTQGLANICESYIYPAEAPAQKGVQPGDWLLGAVYDDKSFAELAKGEDVMRNVSKREQPLNEGRNFRTSAVFPEDGEVAGTPRRTQSQVDDAFNRWGTDPSNRHIVEEPGLVGGMNSDNWLREGPAYLGGDERPNTDDAFPPLTPYKLEAEGGEPGVGMFSPNGKGTPNFLTPEAHGIVTPAGFRPVFKAKERIEKTGRAFRCSFTNIVGC